MPHIQDGLPVGMRPEPVTEAAMLLPDLMETLCVVNDCFDLPARADHTFRVHDTFDICFGIIGDPVIIKAVKAGTEDLPLFDHQAPG